MGISRFKLEFIQWVNLFGRHGSMFKSDESRIMEAVTKNSEL